MLAREKGKHYLDRMSYGNDDDDGAEEEDLKGCERDGDKGDDDEEGPSFSHTALASSCVCVEKLISLTPFSSSP